MGYKVQCMQYSSCMGFTCLQRSKKRAAAALAIDCLHRSNENYMAICFCKRQLALYTPTLRKGLPVCVGQSSGRLLPLLTLHGLLCWRSSPKEASLQLKSPEHSRHLPGLRSIWEMASCVFWSAVSNAIGLDELPHSWTLLNVGRIQRIQFGQK